MDTLTKLTRKRGSARGMLTKLIQKIQNEIGASAIPATKTSLASYLLQLEEKEKKLKELDSKIEDEINDPDKLDTELVESEEYQENIMNCKALCQMTLQDLTGQGQGALRGLSVHQPPTVKLPQIHIEKFSGDINRWSEFWTQFKVTIHNNVNLADEEKLTYLKSYLNGTAQACISGLTLTGINYGIAIDSLKERFGREDLLIQAHMSKLRNMEPVKRSSDTKGLRRFFDTLYINVKSLESLRKDTESYAVFLIPMVTELLPEDIVLSYTQRSRKDTGQRLKGLLEFLQDEVESREQALRLKTTTSSNAPDRDYKHRTEPTYRKEGSSFRSKFTNSSSTMSFNSITKPTKKENNCIFCKELHKIEDCMALTSSERKEIIKSQSRCFVCLGTEHIARFCRTKRVSCKYCGRRHHQTVCEQQFPDKEDTSPDKRETSTNETIQASAMSMGNIAQTGTTKKKPEIYLQTGWARISNGSKDLIVRYFLDNGSHRTYLLEKISRKLNLPETGRESLSMHSFENGSRKVERRRVKFTIGNVSNSQSILIEAMESPKISGARLGFPSEDIITIAEEKGIQLADTCYNTRIEAEDEIGLLVGADFYWKIVTCNTEKIEDSLMAVETIFGWCLLGPTSSRRLVNNDNGIYNVCVMNTVLDEEEEDRVSTGLRAFWDLDSMGIVDKPSESKINDEIIKQDFESKILFDGQRYQVGLPWKKEIILTNDNRAVAERRFEHQLKKFRKNPDLFRDYSEVIKVYLDAGIAEIAHGDGLRGRTFYLPHREVVKRERVTTKTRVVFDASSHSIGSPSLNDCLYAGSPLNVDLLGLLFKFRKHRIAFTGDIEKAFLQVSLSPEDRDVTRFFWIKGNMNADTNTDCFEKIVLRMTRVLFGINASPYLLASTIRHHLEKYKEKYPEIYELLMESLYVDDLLGGADDEENALRLAKGARSVLQEAGMPLRKFQSNSAWVRTQLGEVDQPKNLSLKSESVSLMVLGLTWRPDTDTFLYDVKNLLEFLYRREDSKRFILQASSRIFDPIGFVTPFTIRIKCLFQEIWQRGVQWDEKIPADLKERWESWCLELRYLEEIKIPRFYGMMENDKVQFHCFTDASDKAYGAVVYIRIENAKGEIDVNLVVSKSRVAPLKKMTIPRLELMGAVVGTRIMTTVRSYFIKENPSIQFWSDSTIDISWIKGTTKQWKPFVSNRTSEIQNSYDPVLWRHVPGTLNPADLLTRGLSVKTLVSNQLWWKGPEFLKQSEECWPVQPKTLLTEEDNTRIIIERRPKFTEDTEVLLSLNSEANTTKSLLNLKNYSSYERVVRIIAWVNRFISNIQKKEIDRQKGVLTTDEVERSELYWIKRAQQESFQEEILNVKKNNPVAKYSKMSDLKVFIDQDNLLRVGGRLQFAELAYDEKHPIILPEDHPYTFLLIKERHAKLKHMGVNATMALLRTQFWIPRGRQIIKSLLSKCLKCRIMKSKPFDQDTAPLPPERANIPFEATGVDFAGPVVVKHFDSETKSWATSKSYVALFTCATTRALHLELVSSLSTEHFILALKRFVGRRGVSRIFLSDNAKTFKRTDKEITKLWDSVLTEELKQYFGLKRIQWKFIVDRAPWWGGMWERMVRTVKDCIKKTLGRALLTFEKMETTLVEVESIINSRPITYLSSDQDETTPLTPSHFLIGKRLDTLPPRKFKISEIKTNRDDLTKRWKYRQELINRFWSRWRHEYLLELRTAQKVTRSKSNQPEIKLDDVVIIKDDRLPRHLWKIGRVVELLPGRDGKIRACCIKTVNGHVIKRPLQLLYPMEIS